MEETNINQVENVNEDKKSFFEIHKDLLLEILRFILVGGLATLIDWVISFSLEAILPEMKLGTWSFRGALASTVGFMISLIFNYFLNVIFVYRNKKNKDSGKSFKDFMVFFLISISVLGLQLLMIFLVNDLLFIKAMEWQAPFIKSLTWGYMLAKVFATAVGLVINYILRKKLIFK